MCGAERFRQAAGASEVEYGLELEISRTGPDLAIGKYGANPFNDRLGPISEDQIVFPRYSVGPPQEYSALCKVLERDFWNAAGHEFENLVEIDFQAAFARIGLQW